MVFKNIRKKSIISVNNRISGFKIFKEQISVFFNAKVTFIHFPNTKKRRRKLGIEEKHLRQNVILKDNGSIMYIVVTDVDKKQVPFLIKVQRKSLPFEKMERKLAGSISALLTGYFSKFRRGNDFERIIPVLSHDFITTVIAHQLKVDNYSIEEILSLISQFQKIILRSYEGESVSTGVILSRNFYFIKQKKEELSIKVTPIGNMFFNRSLLNTKRGVLLVNGSDSFFLINKKRRIHAIISKIDSFKCSAASLEGVYQPEPTWVCRVLRGRDYALYSTKNRELELICRGNLKLKYKQGFWSTVPLMSFYNIFKNYFDNIICSYKLLKLIEILSSRRKGALFIIIEGNIPDDLIQKKKDIIDEKLIRNLSLLSTQTSIIENLASIDGAVILNISGDILAFGAYINPKGDIKNKVEGTRSLAAISASYFGISIKVSHDGDISVFKNGDDIFHIM